MFIEKFNQGYDVVYAQRINRKEPWWLRVVLLRFLPFMSLSDIRLPLTLYDFGLMSRRVVDQLQMPEHHRYIRGLAVGLAIAKLAFPSSGRNATRDGRNTVPCLLGLAFDGIFAFSIVPCVQQRFSALLIWDSQAYSLSTAFAKFF